MKNFNQNNFLFDVGQRDWSRIRVVSDADEKWNEWENMLMTFINKHAPVKKEKSWQKNVPLDYVKWKIVLCNSQITSLNDERGAVSSFEQIRVSDWRGTLIFT